MQRTIRTAMAGAMVMLGFAPLAAHAAGAPPGDSSATAAHAGDAVVVGQSRAHAGPDGTSAGANPLGLGPPFSVYPFGGEQKGSGRKGGALANLGTRATGPKLQLLPWNAAVTDSSGQSHAEGDAAILRAGLGDLFSVPLDLSVLDTRSSADYRGGASTGTSSSDGLLLNAGNGLLSVDLLHADANSSGTGSSYVADVNGNRVLSGSQASGQCAQSVPDVIALSCLSAAGGPGSFSSEVAGATIGGPSSGGQVAAGLSSTTSSGTGATGAGTGAVTPPPSVSGSSSVAPTNAGDVVTAAPARGSLPTTGGSPWFLVVSALALCALGGNLVVMGRRLRAYTS